MQAHLLVLYILAGAGEVLSGQMLSGRSRWAVEDAIARLRAQRDVVDAGHADETNARVALMSPSAGSSVQFAELVLQSIRTVQLESDATLEEHERRSSERLGQLIDGLERLLEGDANAARRIDDVFRAIVTRRGQRKAFADII